jgi:S-DNA-T family DNA segregation ATPase FtsK/SpoIIIE
MSLLAEPKTKPKRTAQEIQANIETLESTLEEFGVDANVVEIATGPTVTRFEIQLGPGIRVARITALADNIAMNLAASHVRVEAPIPGKAAIGVEVPNSSPTMVALRETLDNREFMDNPSRLIIGLGQDVSGVNRYADLTRMPHMLIGGATNSGKSIGLASIIMSLLMRNTPKDLKFVMIDPKRVELALFDNIPHLLCPVIKDVKEAPGVLRAVWREMDRRYDLLSEHGVRNIDGWNAKASFQDRMPYIVVVIDELADLMIQARAEVETSIVRLAQLARAVGIHLVIATQRPSVDVITGTIKANIPSRVAFAVSAQVDSRTILDTKGAEDLIGRGDMLYMPIDASKPMRIQGCYVSEKEIESVCEFWRAQERPTYVLQPIIEAANRAERGGDGESDESDPLWEEAVMFVAERGQASTSMMQRRFSIGFQRASRLLDMMEERSIVGPRDGPRPREVLVDAYEAQALFGRNVTPAGAGIRSELLDDDDPFAGPD